MAVSSILPLLARRLEGKVAMITGGASGIGECTAKLFASHGARVVIADIQDDKGHTLCNDIGSSAASYVHCDVTSEPDVQAAVDTAVDKYGKLDIMFSNAGIVDKCREGILNIDKPAFERVLATNLTGSFLATKHAARVMVPARSGSIVIAASVGSVMGGMTPYAYACSKHGAVGLMRNAAAELGKHGIRVNCVSPYLVATPLAMDGLELDDEGLEEFGETMGNLKGVRLKKKDIAEAVLYLGSEEARYVSGVNLLVDGGLTSVKIL